MKRPTLNSAFMYMVRDPDDTVMLTTKRPTAVYDDEGVFSNWETDEYDNAWYFDKNDIRNLLDFEVDSFNHWLVRRPEDSLVELT